MGGKSLLDRFDDAKDEIHAERNSRRRNTLSLVNKTSHSLRSVSQRKRRPSQNPADGGGSDDADAGAGSGGDGAVDTKRAGRSVFHKDVKSSFARRHEEGQAAAAAGTRGGGEYSSTMVAIQMVEKKTRAMKLHAVASRYA